MTPVDEKLKLLIAQLESAEDDAGYNGHTDAAHKRILNAINDIIIHQAKKGIIR
jgi:hypothetical protein